MLIRLAVLFSGNGSNLENLIQKLHQKTIGKNSFEIALCLSNNKNALGIERASKYGLKTTVIEHVKFKNRQDFDKALLQTIKESRVDLTVLAGFMRILSPIFTQNIKAINLHPSLLPLFKGANAIEESFKSDMKLGGVTVHEVNEELDGGKIIAQEAFQKEKLSFEEFKIAIHSLEHELLPKVIIGLFE